MHGQKDRALSLKIVISELKFLFMSEFQMQSEAQRRESLESNLNQKARVIWLTGLSGAGKTTLGAQLENMLSDAGYICRLLDGDVLRKGICSGLAFSVDDRTENIRRAAEVSKLFIHSGIITINCFITPTHDIRRLVRDIIGKDDLIEVFIDAPIEVCEERDTKGLYRMAREGKVLNFTGINSPFDVPLSSDLVIKTNEESPEESVRKLFRFVLPNIKAG